MSVTLLAPCDYQETIRKSRFLAKAAPVTSVGDAQAFIEAVSVQEATHNCWAWKIGRQYRFSDDGEPGGTAGRPMLTAIEGQDCDRVVVVVTRWYGGIQLGTGGLARAYGGCAAKCLQAGERIALVDRREVSVHCLFSELPRIRARLAEFDAQVEAEAFEADGALLRLSLPLANLDALGVWLADLSRGRIRLTQ
ncbi:IMPACT family protein [Stutzerimonas urumqiensis]|uniref:IMPACT family protein n=1 Tax=Stutzerimonas urumqiensis TaxID=638269 RepID=UPI000EADD3BF|nr:YigZ family protein [Stutzerimonas urumqiensis]